MDLILLAYDLPPKIVMAIIMLYKNMKAMVCSPDGDTDFFQCCWIGGISIIVGYLMPHTFYTYISNIYDL